MGRLAPDLFATGARLQAEPEPVPADPGKNNASDESVEVEAARYPMPVTPFHLGPALLLKAVAGRRFSLGAFTIVQVSIDAESAANLLMHRYPVHRFLHTLVGAVIVSAVVALASPWLLTRCHRSLRRWLESRGRDAPWVQATFGPVGFVPAATGAVTGGVSHVLLDAVMHRDLRPFPAWIEGNPLQRDGALVWLHLGCIVAGMAGAFFWLARHAVPADR